MTIKGYVELSKNNGTDLINKCRRVLGSKPNFEKKSYTQFSFRKMRKVTIDYDVCPHWYPSKESLNSYFDNLELMINRPDPVYLSLLCYENIILLANGSNRANPIFIMNY